MKKLFGLLLSLVLFVGCFGNAVFAQETTYPKATHVYTTTEDYASDEWSVDQRGAYLSSGTCSIARADSTHINISGLTTCTQTCDKVKLVLYVERSTSYATGYGNYRTYTYNAEDVYQLAKAVSNIKVDKGYYYRVAAVHSVTHNGVTETNNSVTDPIDYR